MLAVAFRTKPGRRPAVSAVVADERIGTLVVGKGNSAIPALHGLAAGAAEDDRGVSAPVQQDHGLLVAFQALAHLLRQLPGTDALFPGPLKLRPHGHAAHL